MAALGSPMFDEVSYMFVATTAAGLERLAERAGLQQGLGVPVEEVDPTRVRGLRADDVLGAYACWEDGVAEPAGGPPPPPPPAGPPGGAGGGGPPAPPPPPPPRAPPPARSDHRRHERQA